MKKKAAGIIIFFVSFLFVVIIFNVNANPSYQGSHSNGSCHENTGNYAINVNISTSIEANASSNILFYVNASGDSNVMIYAYNGYLDNNKFIYNGADLTTQINDGDAEDQNPAVNEMQVFVNITTPATVGYYYLFIIAGDSTSGQPAFAEITIGISVGGAIPPPPQIDVFSHLGMIFGPIALTLITLGTVLVLYDENKFVKVHGYLGGVSWILTLINVLFLFRIPLSSWTAYSITIHWPHIVFGVIGLVAGLFSLLFGVAAERKYAKLTGYVTLVSWWTAFLLGLILIL